MNKYEKLVQQQFLNDEETVIKRLKQIYGQSLKDINKKVFELDSSISMLQKALDSIDGDEIGDLAAAVLKSKRHYTPEEARETIKSMLQSKVYQKKYQDALKSQVGGILDKMQDKEFKTVSDYLTQCYENGFVGTMYDLQGQGIPLCFPLDQEQMVRAVQLDSKISKGLYQRLGEDVTVLKKKIAAQISRGISTGMSYQQVAQQLAGETNIGFNNAVRIARTEGHRIQCQAGMDACEKAKEKGADVVKQWDSTMDSRTRESHVAVDGEIRELDEKFSNGLMFPGDPAGGAAEVINCRCALLQRARWALDEDELKTLQDRAEYFGLDKTDSFEDYKNKYLKAVEMQQDDFVVTPPKEYDGVFDDFTGLHLSEEESTALQRLWAASKASGFEHGIVIENGVVGNPVTSNLPNAVKIPTNSHGHGLSLLHSHTNSTPPSIKDFQRLLEEGVDKIGVVCYNKDVYLAYIGNGERPSLEDFLATAESISKSVDFEIMEHPDFFYWTVEERNYMAIREQAFRIAQHYGWTLEGGRINVG